MAKTKTSTKPRPGVAPSAKTASRKPKTSSGKSASNHKAHPAAHATVTIDRRRGSRREDEKAVVAPPVAVAPVRLEHRQKVESSPSNRSDDLRARLHR